MATGVLVLGVDRATRLLGHLALHDKSYDATIRLGASTVTDDREGEIIAVASQEECEAISNDHVYAALRTLTGRIHQRPSSVSAIKVDGRRAYDLVRSGEEVELPEREVEITEIVIAAISRDAAGIDVDVSVTCSTGTYIRAIARDLGHMLHVGGHLTSLRRTRVGPFKLQESVGIDHIASGLRSMDDIAPRCFPVVVLDVRQADDARHGRPQMWPGDSSPGPYALVDEAGTLIALGHREGAMLKYAAVFATD
jgi:tRNA pseudouridine55 synthase